MGQLIDESADVCLYFSGHVTSQAFERVLSFCWNSRCMYFVSPHTLCVFFMLLCGDSCTRCHTRTQHACSPYSCVVIAAHGATHAHSMRVLHTHVW